jgi:cbb3-type cytochrome oxidase maturation protein
MRNGIALDICRRRAIIGNMETPDAGPTTNESNNRILNIMYFPYFVAYILIGLAISLTAFIWALRNGQFGDQDRARYLPLRGDGEKDQPPKKATRLGRLETIGLLVLACAGLAATLAVLIYAIFFN